MDINKISLRPQVITTHYYSKSYLSTARFEGLQGQLEFTMNSPISDSFLEIGPGPGLFAALLRNFSYKVTTIDFASDLFPNVTGALPYLPFRSNSFDVVCAFEVLEHIPYNSLGKCISEMARIARKKIYFSIPSQQEIFQSQMRIDLIIGRKKFSKRFWKKDLGRLTNPKEHYWEIGLNGVSCEKIIELCELSRMKLSKQKFYPPWFQLFEFDIL